MLVPYDVCTIVIALWCNINNYCNNSRCVCKTCSEDLKRHSQSEQYVPRWKKTKRVCAVTSCTTNSAKVKNCKQLSVKEIQMVLKDTCGFSDDNEHSSDGVILCQHHYNKVYRAVPTN